MSHASHSHHSCKLCEEQQDKIRINRPRLLESSGGLANWAGQQIAFVALWFFPIIMWPIPRRIALVSPSLDRGMNSPKCLALRVVIVSAHAPNRLDQ